MSNKQNDEIFEAVEDGTLTPESSQAQELFQTDEQKAKLVELMFNSETKSFDYSMWKHHLKDFIDAFKDKDGNPRSMSNFDWHAFKNFVNAVVRAREKDFLIDLNKIKSKDDLRNLIEKYEKGEK